MKKKSILYFKLSILFIVILISNFSFAQEKTIDGWRVENKVFGENDDNYIVANNVKSKSNVIATDAPQTKSIFKNAFPIKFNTRSTFALLIKDYLGVDGQDLYNYKFKKALEDLHYETTNGITAELFFGFFLNSNNIFTDDYKNEHIAEKFSKGFNNQTIIVKNIEDSFDIIDGYYFLKKSSEDLTMYTYIKNGKISGGISIAEDITGNLYFGILDKSNFSIYGRGLIKYKTGIKYLGPILNNKPDYIKGNFNGIEFKKPRDEGRFYLSDWTFIKGEIVNNLPQGYAERLNFKTLVTELVLFDKGKISKILKDNESITSQSVIENTVGASISNTDDYLLSERDKKHIKGLVTALAGGSKKYALKDCYYCEGNGVMKTCIACQGKGNLYCKECNGRKFTRDGRVCLDCRGKGIVMCNRCLGKRYNVKCTHQISL
jgi:hypothetical protein